MRVVQVASGGREIDMMNVEPESAGDARTRSLRRERQSSPLRASPSASQIHRAVEQDSPAASQMLGAAE